jgi:hypothetical protein
MRSLCRLSVCVLPLSLPDKSWFYRSSVTVSYSYLQIFSVLAVLCLLLFGFLVSIASSVTLIQPTGNNQQYGVISIHFMFLVKSVTQN